MPEFAHLTQTGIEQLAREMLRSAVNAPKEFARARVDLRRAANTESSRQITAIFNLSQQRVKQDLTVRDTTAGVIVSGPKRTISLLSYRFRPSPKGLRGKVVKAGKSVQIPGAFIGTAIGGGTVPFYRHGTPRRMTKGRYVGQMRQPLKALHGPSVADQLKDTRVSIELRDRILARTGEQLRKRLSRIRGR